jgi:hypothetical protein
MFTATITNFFMDRSSFDSLKKPCVGASLILERDVGRMVGPAHLTLCQAARGICCLILDNFQKINGGQEAASG